MIEAKELKQAARQAGADLVGIAPPDRFDALPAHQHPAAIMPAVRSIIVIARRIPRGCIRPVEEGTNFQTYELFGYYWLDTEFLALTAYELCAWLEDRGFEAVPIFPFPPEAWPQGVPVREGQPAPNVQFPMDYAAVAAGLGELSWCRIVLTPQFGPLQRFQAILTDAPLQPDPVQPQRLCSICRFCAEVCPLGAIGPAEEEVEIAGQRYRAAAVDYSLCRRCPNGALPNRYHSSGQPDRLAALCVRSCLVMLEGAGKIAATYEAPFRRGRWWALDALGRPAEPGEDLLKMQGTGCDDPGGMRRAAESDG